MTEGKVESGLSIWRCPVCGFWHRAFSEQHANCPSDKECARTEMERVSVTPTADVRELVEAGRIWMDSGLTISEPLCKALELLDPTYGEGGW